MSNSSSVANGKIRLYACGGAGINVAQFFERARGAAVEAGFGSIDPVYIDTSRSNVYDTISAEHCYIMDDMDGSGKVRSENHEVISTRIRAILQKFPAGDVSIVISSAAGGSGSVIAPLLVSELLENESAVIVLAIGSADTRLDAENTLKTIKSYEAISRMRKTPVIMGYVQNGAGRSRAANDETMINTITNLTMLYSRHNRELDSRDLFNWLNYSRVTSFKAQVTALTLHHGNVNKSELGNIISVATLAINGSDTVLDETPEYQCVGYVPVELEPSLNNKEAMHFITSDAVIPQVVLELNRILSTLEKNQKARIAKAEILTGDDTSTGTGLVL